MLDIKNQVMAIEEHVPKLAQRALGTRKRVLDPRASARIPKSSAAAAKVNARVPKASARAAKVHGWNATASAGGPKVVGVVFDFH